MWKLSERMGGLPPYLFIEIDRKKKELQEKGFEVINFGVGDPDMPTLPRIVEALKCSVSDSSVHRYPFGKGRKDFRSAIAGYYDRYYNASIDPEEEICVLIGSKEGIAHFPFAFLNPGEYALIPEPGYPVYHIGTFLAGGQSYFMPLRQSNGFLPDLGAIPSSVREKAKLLYLNYPNNPTSCCAPEEFLLEAIQFCKDHHIILLYDAAYAEIFYEGKRPISFLSLPGAKEVGIEFHSLSKTYNMTGWRVGWACGNPSLVRGLASLKENIDSGTFEALQLAGLEALSGPQTDVADLRAIYQRRRDVLVEGLKKRFPEIIAPEATFYVWLKVSGDGADFAQTLLEKAQIVVTPGIGFGPSGKEYVRFALTINEEKITEALARMEKI